LAGSSETSVNNDKEAVFAFLNSRFGDKIHRTEIFRGDSIVVLEPGIIVDALLALRDNFKPSYNFLSFLTAEHWIEHETPSQSVPPVFWVIYFLRSLPSNGNCLRIVLEIPDTPEASVPSVTSVYPGADWHEREVFDLFGIKFAGHPNLTRILTPETYEEHPLRRDFPHGGPKLQEFHDRMVAEWNVREERDYLGKFGDPWVSKIMEQQTGRISLERVGELAGDGKEIELPGDIAHGD
jgi:NADH-quinone oxidoreductase subunit C